MKKILLFLALFALIWPAIALEQAPETSPVYCEQSVSQIRMENRANLGILFTSESAPCLCFEKEQPQFTDWINLFCFNKANGVMIQERTRIEAKQPFCTEFIEFKEFRASNNDVCRHCPEPETIGQWQPISCINDKQIQKRSVIAYYGEWNGIGAFTCEKKTMEQFQFVDAPNCIVQGNVLTGLGIGSLAIVAIIIVILAMKK